MSVSQIPQSQTRVQFVLIGSIATVLMLGAFQLGRQSVAAPRLGDQANERQGASAKLPPEKKPEQLPEHSNVTIRNIATVPFSELYDVLRAAPREQLLAWAKDLEGLPRGPRQNAAVTAYYKSLIQVDSAAAIEAVFRAKNLPMRDVAMDAIGKAAPESIWGDLAELEERISYPKRTSFREDAIWNWSRVDPVAASQFIESHPKSGEDRRLTSLLWNWGGTDPAAALDWLAEDPTRQTLDAYAALISGWDELDRAAAIDYAVANAGTPILAEGIRHLVYTVFIDAPEDARSTILRLPADEAESVMGKIAHNTAGVFVGSGAPSQKPFAEVATWMLTFSPELWRNNIGEVFGEWIRRDPDKASEWVNELRPETRDAVVASFCRNPNGDATNGQVVALGLTISDAHLRNQALGEFVRGLGGNRAAAMEAVDGLDISGEEKALLRDVMLKEAGDEGR